MKALFRVNYSHGQDYYASKYSTVIVSFSHNSIVLGRHSVAAQDPFGWAPGFVTWARTKGSARTGKWSGTQPSSRPIESCRPPGQLSSEFFMAFLVFFFLVISLSFFWVFPCLVSVWQLHFWTVVFGSVPRQSGMYFELVMFGTFYGATCTQVAPRTFGFCFRLVWLANLLCNLNVLNCEASDRTNCRSEPAKS